MYAVLIAIGLVVLVGLSVAVGMVLAAERLHRQRRHLSAQRWTLWSWEQELLNLDELRGCRSCQLLRRRAELQHPPTDMEAA